MTERDFRQRQHFPGTTGNWFDVTLHGIVTIQRTPAILFAVFLFTIAALAARFHWGIALVWWGFFLADWLLLSGLPRLKKSYGPSKPPVLVLAVLRALVAQLPFFIALPAQFLGTILVIYAFWIEPHRILLTRQTLTSPKLKPGSPIKILHLGDLHLERVTARERQLIDLVKTTQPDIILFSGDILNLSYLKDPLAWQDARSIISQWTAPFGVYLVNGSPAVDLPDVFPNLIDDLPVHWLRDERISLTIRDQQIDLIGVTCTHRPFADGPKLDALTGSPSNHFTVLLYHTPDLALIAAQDGIDLQLSGHTHGGQVRLPLVGALFTGSLYGKRFEAGRLKVGNMILYVTRGMGMEGAGAPRVRFLCPPEVILWEISGEAL